MRSRARLLTGLLALPLLAAPASARVYVTQEEALRQAFPPPLRVERRVLYLDDEQARRAGERAGAPVEARVIPYYAGLEGDRPAGYAYFDTHLVRTLPETVLVLLTSEGLIRRIEIVAFDEPEDYLPGARWMRQFDGAGESDSLRPGGRIHALTGATLSARAVMAAARRILAVHALFVGPPGAGAGGDAREANRP